MKNISNTLISNGFEEERDEVISIVRLKIGLPLIIWKEFPIKPVTRNFLFSVTTIYIDDNLESDILKM